MTLEVPVGSIFAFLGANGAGKTTTMRILLGLIRADAGSVRLLGHDLHRQRLKALGRVGALIESPALYDHLTGRANLDLTRRLLDLPASEVDRVLEIVDLSDAAKQRVGAYSLGMKQRLALARSLLGAPRLLLLDEPTNGLDPDSIVAMRMLIRSLPERIGGTVFMSSHILPEVEQTATVVGVMNAGQLVLQGSVATLLGNHRTLHIALDDAARGTRVLADMGVEILETREGVIRLLLPKEASALDDAATMNRLLVEAGLRVSALTPERRTLEEVYRDAAKPHQGMAA